jgi:hypothetical protein
LALAQSIRSCDQALGDHVCTFQRCICCAKGFCIQRSKKDIMSGGQHTATESWPCSKLWNVEVVSCPSKFLCYDVCGHCGNPSPTSLGLIGTIVWVLTGIFNITDDEGGDPRLRQAFRTQVVYVMEMASILTDLFGISTVMYHYLLIENSIRAMRQQVLYLT